ncbi:MAG: glycosyltransferase family 4 protein [Firmicutes bacterium]|nr:glycosyltransferase family 4 protein [Bacillota bacterium]
MGIRNKRILLVVRPADGGIREHVLQLYYYLCKKTEKVVLAAPPDSYLYKEASAKGYPAVGLPLKDGLHFLHDRRAFSILLTAVKQFNIQLIHAHGFKAALIARLVAHLTRVPALVSIHSFPAWFLPLGGGKKWWCLAEKYLQRYTQRYITVSFALEEMLVGCGVSRNKITTVYNGIKIQKYAPLQGTQGDQAEIKVGMLGRLIGAKGPDLFLESMPRILRQHPGVRFVIAGDGPWQLKLRNMSRQLGLQGKVDFIGRPMSVSTLLHQLKVLVIPSRTEGLSITALEALAAQCPVVASKVGGIPEVVRHGQTGLLVAPEDTEALADAVIYLLDNPQYGQRLARAGRLLVEKQFTLDNMLKRIEQIYEEILQGIPQKKGVVVKFASR